MEQHYDEELDIKNKVFYIKLILWKTLFFTKEQQITIENFISYYINRYRCMSSKNCHETYQADLINDIDGDLHKFANWFWIWKKIHEKRKLKKLNLNKNVI